MSDTKSRKSARKVLIWLSESCWSPNRIVDQVDTLIKVATKLKAKGVAIDIIAESTGLTQDEIDWLRFLPILRLTSPPFPANSILAGRK